MYDVLWQQIKITIRKIITPKNVNRCGDEVLSDHPCNSKGIFFRASIVFLYLRKTLLHTSTLCCAGTLSLNLEWAD